MAHTPGMRFTISRIVRRLACLGLVALVLAGCAETPGYYDQPTARRCDRNGDIDERRAC
ncbi:MAG TPA: hypothetical protein VFF43_16490 [Caldimonas sp.]|nr:hypothetical protein [Caldimonas sp.]